MTHRELSVYDQGKLQPQQAEPMMPQVRLERGKYGMKLDIIPQGNILQQIAQRIAPPELHPLPLDQVFLFAHVAIGFWTGNYAILIRILRETSFQAETLGRIKTAYHFYGIDGNTKAMPLGVARHPSSIQTFLQAKGIVINQWYPVHELPDHLAESTSWTGFSINACLLRMQREQSQIVLVHGDE